MGECNLALDEATETMHKLSLSIATKAKDNDDIPLIDLSLLNSPNSPNPIAISRLAADIGGACKNWGFFQVINHGVPLELRQKMEVASRKFFSQPAEEKRKVNRGVVNPLGYYDSEFTNNVRDWKELLDVTVEEPTVMPASPEVNDKELRELINRWPQYPSDFRVTCEKYAQEMEKLSYKLLELISLSLGLPRQRLNGFFKDQTSLIRFNHYPPCPNSNQALGAGQHKDAGALTILAQDDVGGLEVKSKKDGEWFRVKPNPDAYIINICDIIQVWSNEKYESVLHRVMVNSERERFSIAFFFNPAHYVVVEPLGELINEQNPAKYRAYNWGKFYASRKHSNFMNLGIESIQIHHFKVLE